jgi:phosphatidylserine decarboxylase
MIARDGYPYIVIPIVGSLGSIGLELPVVAVVFLAFAAFMAYFFRDPSREVPGDESAIVSPADGKVVSIVKLDAGNPASPTRLSIFLSVFDVHVNRAPMAGIVKDVAFHRGKFKAAFAEEASAVNEQSIITIAGQGTELVFKQIAGLIARRIVFTKRAGELVSKGERVGLIKFGSRVDVIFPPGVEITAERGQRVRGGSSIIGRIRS